MNRNGIFKVCECSTGSSDPDIQHRLCPNGHNLWQWWASPWTKQCWEIWWCPPNCWKVCSKLLIQTLYQYMYTLGFASANKCDTVSKISFFFTHKKVLGLCLCEKMMEYVMLQVCEKNQLGGTELLHVSTLRSKTTLMKHQTSICTPWINTFNFCSNYKSSTKKW